MNRRQEYNKKIIKLLELVVEKYPDLRFCQILSTLDLDKNNFHEESDVTYKVIKDIIACLYEDECMGTINRLLERTS